MSACKVVLVEDNPADVFLVQLSLEENGVSCELIVFSTGDEALEALCPPEWSVQSPILPDIILVDLNIPGIDGFTVLTRIRQTSHLAQVPVAIFTSSQASSDRDRALHLGAARYIVKPSRLEAFLTTVGQAVQELLAPASRA